MDRFSDVEELDMPMERPAHTVHDTPAPIFAGAPGWKKDFCNNRREEAHSSLIHRHLYGRPYRELSGAYMVLRHLTRFGSHLGSGVSTQFCLHFKDEYDAHRTSAVWYTADTLSELKESDIDGCAAIAVVCPHPVQGKLRPTEDDVRARLKPYYDRIIPSSQSAKLFYATFSTTDAALAALHRKDLDRTGAGFVVEVYDCSIVRVTLEFHEKMDQIAAVMINKLASYGVLLHTDVQMRVISSRTVEFAFPTTQIARAFALSTLYRSPAITPYFKPIYCSPRQQCPRDEQAEAPPPYSAFKTPLASREINISRTNCDELKPSRYIKEKTSDLSSSDGTEKQSIEEAPSRDPPNYATYTPLVYRKIKDISPRGKGNKSITPAASDSADVYKNSAGLLSSRDKAEKPQDVSSAATPARSTAAIRRRSRPPEPSPFAVHKAPPPLPADLASEAAKRMVQIRELHDVIQRATQEVATLDRQREFYKRRLEAVRGEADGEVHPGDSELVLKMELQENEMDMMNSAAELETSKASLRILCEGFEQFKDKHRQVFKADVDPLRVAKKPAISSARNATPQNRKAVVQSSQQLSSLDRVQGARASSTRDEAGKRSAPIVSSHDVAGKPAQHVFSRGSDQAKPSSGSVRSRGKKSSYPALATTNPFANRAYSHDRAQKSAPSTSSRHAGKSATSDSASRATLTGNGAMPNAKSSAAIASENPLNQARSDPALTRRRRAPSTPAPSTHGPTRQTIADHPPRRLAHQERRARTPGPSEHAASARATDASSSLESDIENTEDDIQRKLNKIETLKCKKQAYERRLAILRGEIDGEGRVGDTEQYLFGKLWENEGDRKLLEEELKGLQLHSRYLYFTRCERERRR
ncbi:uncharacterized protein SCHCODRAFT_02693099 [Schizophyllum commune H4-8]|nr:uncharacterized protein SCHCODRAFT_02693099 [Schizophyllum commune H4-8]KAI5886289.1 hypothetical protein SCHCODRAFT_02693099 [Schizophyllum commune H4-8]